MFDFVNKKLAERQIVTENEDFSQEDQDNLEYIFGEDEESGEAILNENENLLEEDDDSDILEAMDKYLVASMKEQMRLEVLADSDFSDSDKVKALQKISEITFEEEDVLEFAEQYIKPILEICESFIDNDSKDAIVVPVPVYEVCAILEDAKLGRITDIYMVEDEEAMVTDTEDQYEKDNKDTNGDEDDGTAEDNVDNISSGTGDNVINAEMAMELINLSLDEHNVIDKNDRDAVINESINLMAMYGFDSLRPNIIEVVESVYFHDKKAEDKGQKRFFEIMEDIKSGESFPIENFGSLDENTESVGDYFINENTENRIMNFIGGRYDYLTEDAISDALSGKKDTLSRVEDHISKLWNLGRGKHKVIVDKLKKYYDRGNELVNKYGKTIKRSALTLTAAAILAVSIAAYRNKKYGVCMVVKNRADKVKCLISACEDAIRAIKAQKHGCKEFAKSPAKCEIRSDKLILKWEKKKHRYMEKLVSIKQREHEIEKNYHRESEEVLDEGISSYKKEYKQLYSRLKKIPNTKSNSKIRRLLGFELERLGQKHGIGQNREISFRSGKKAADNMSIGKSFKKASKDYKDF